MWKEETGKISFLNKFADDVKLRSMVDKLEGKAATSRGLNRLEKWAESSIMKLNKVKYEVLHLDRLVSSTSTNWARTREKVALQKRT